VKHGALLDAQLLAQVYVELTGGRQIGLSLGTAATAAEAVVAVQVERIARPARPHAPSDEERTRHRGFIARLTEPLWERFLAPV
jgi:DNA polymerase-3 subunit epsilon